MTIRNPTPTPAKAGMTIRIRVVEGGFPHSEIHGSKPVRGSPWLIAAYHVLHRLSAPRHPPNALKSLDRSHDRCPFFWMLALSQTQKTSRSKKQKDRSPAPFRTNDLMLAERNHHGSALAATTATFPLNDVDDLPPRAIPMDLHKRQNLCLPDSPNAPRQLKPQGKP